MINGRSKQVKYVKFHVYEKTHFFCAAFFVRARKNPLNVVPPFPLLGMPSKVLVHVFLNYFISPCMEDLLYQLSKTDVFQR